MPTLLKLNYFCIAICREDILERTASLTISSTCMPSIHILLTGIYQRSIDGLSALLLSFKKRPNTIRFSGSSALSESFARDMKAHMDKYQEVFDFRQVGGGNTGEWFVWSG
jgi:hypothetical protein